MLQQLLGAHFCEGLPHTLIGPFRICGRMALWILQEGIYTTRTPSTGSATICTMETRRRKKDEELVTKMFLSFASIRAFLTFIQFVILGTFASWREIADSVMALDVVLLHIACYRPETLFKDVVPRNDLKLMTTDFVTHSSRPFSH